VTHSGSGENLATGEGLVGVQMLDERIKENAATVSQLFLKIIKQQNSSSTPMKIKSCHKLGSLIKE
jgi:hypothetical protein